jgi:hypothetical protein
LGCGASSPLRHLATRRILRALMGAQPNPGPFSEYAPTAYVFKPESTVTINLTHYPAFHLGV